MQTGTKEWAKKNINFQRGCEHNCRYCYARYDAVKRFHQCKAEDWPNPVIISKRVDCDYYKSHGTIMFPSSHDITENNISEALCILHKLVDAGNQILIVSKPHWHCITLICEEFKQYHKQIQFRFTIGSTNDEILSFWEPMAPKFEERLTCLILAKETGYQTSVSCEPYLDPWITHLYEICKDGITDSFWIGKLRNFEQRVSLAGLSVEQIEKYVLPLKKIQSDDFVMSVYELLNGKPFVRWKDSIQKVLNAKGIVIDD
jgi:DNA repair photolyase